MEDDPRSAVRLAVDSIDHFTSLLRSEMAVARAEFGEKVSEAATGAASFALAGILLIPVIVVAMIAAAAWLTELGLRSSLAHGASALAGLSVVGAIALFGKAKLGPSTFTMERPVRLDHGLPSLGFGNDIEHLVAERSLSVVVLPSATSVQVDEVGPPSIRQLQPSPH